MNDDWSLVTRVSCVQANGRLHSSADENIEFDLQTPSEFIDHCSMMFANHHLSA